MKRLCLRPLALGLSLALLFSLSGQAAQAPVYPFRVLPQTVDAPFIFDEPLPASRPVSVDWFADAVFIGDARLKELLAAELFQPGLVLAEMGFNVRDVRSDSGFSLNGERISLRQVLKGTKYRKVYLALGFNEASWMGEQEFYEEYEALIDDLQALLPETQIYIQTLIPVTVSRAAAQAPDNALLESRNALLAQLAQNKRVYLADVAAYLTEPNGALEPGFSRDGLHLTAEGNARWFEYLRTHTMGA